MHNTFNMFISLFAIMNPLVALTVFLDLTKTFSKKDKRKITIVCCLTILIILSLALFFGKFLIDMLDIHPYTLQLGGGILILLMGIETLFKKDSDHSIESPSEESLSKRKRLTGIGVTPLALPLIAGPGSILMVILFGENSDDIYHKFLIFLIILSLCIIVYILFTISNFVSKILGDLGIMVLSKMLGLILSALAFELIVSGVKGALPIVLSGLNLK
jgi:multiple antibiotic resistance protein